MVKTTRAFDLTDLKIIWSGIDILKLRAALLLTLTKKKMMTNIK